MNRGPRISRWLILLLSFLVVSASFAFIVFYDREESLRVPEDLESEWVQAKPAVGILHSGDLVFRHARGTISNMLARFSRKDPRYSHAGIISIEGDKIFVYHALGGEATPNGGIRKELFENYCHPARVHAFGIYRLDLDKEKMQKALELAGNWYRERIVFDMEYNLQTDTALYCTEFVYKILVEASGNKNYITLTKVPGFTYVACDNLYLNSHSTLICAHSYAD